jgi:tRNA pseudouridine55 synthase
MNERGAERDRVSSGTSRKIASPAHGWIILNKEVGISSAQAVARVRRIFGGVKTGHGGTLDPLACGVLPIALGEATKTISYVMGAEKSYHFTLAWGSETQTDDAEGDVTRTSDNIPDIDDINAVLPRFVGEIEQVPPDYSAVKIEGKRAYAMARQRDKDRRDKDRHDKDGPVQPAMPSLAPRKIMIYAFSLLSCDSRTASFHVHCGKGAYIRALARDLGRALGSAAHVTRLERMSVGRFSHQQSISLDFLTELADNAAAQTALLDVKTVLDDIPALALTDSQAQRLRHGQLVDWPHDVPEADIMVAYLDDTPIAFVSHDGHHITPKRVFNL